jgi:hypothetical protein
MGHFEPSFLKGLDAALDTPGQLSWTTLAGRAGRKYGDLLTSRTLAITIIYNGSSFRDGPNLYMYVHVLSRRRATRRQKGVVLRQWAECPTCLESREPYSRQLK